MKFQKIFSVGLFVAVLVGCGKNPPSISSNSSQSSVGTSITQSTSVSIPPNPIEEEINIATPILEIVKTVWDATQREEFEKNIEDGVPVELFAAIIENAGLNKEQSALFLQIFEYLILAQDEDAVMPDMVELIDDFMANFDGDSLGNLLYSMINNIITFMHAEIDSEDYYMNVISKEQALEIANSTQNQDIKDFYLDIYENFDKYNYLIDARAHATDDASYIAAAAKIDRATAVYFGRAVMAAANALYINGQYESIMEMVAKLMGSIEEDESVTDVINDLMSIMAVVLEKSLLTSNSYKILLDSFIRIARAYVEEADKPSIGRETVTNEINTIKALLDYMEQNVTGMMLKSINKLLVSILKNVTIEDIEHFFMLFTESYDEEQAYLFDDYYPTFVKVSQALTRAFVALTEGERNNLTSFMNNFNRINNDYLIDLGSSDIELHIDGAYFISSMARFSVYKYDSLTVAQMEEIDIWIEEFREDSIITLDIEKKTQYWIIYDDEIRYGDAISLKVEVYNEETWQYVFLDENEFEVSGYSSAVLGYHILTVKIGDYEVKCAYYVYPTEYEDKFFSLDHGYNDGLLLFNIDKDYSTSFIYFGIYTVNECSDLNYEYINLSVSDLIGLDLSKTGKGYAFIKYGEAYLHFEYVAYEMADLIQKAGVYNQYVYQDEAITSIHIEIYSELKVGEKYYYAELIDYIVVDCASAGIVLDTSELGTYTVEFNYRGEIYVFEYTVE